MQKIFIDYIPIDSIELDADQSRHIAKSLRMKIGDELVAVAPDSMEYCCQIIEITKENVRLEVCYKRPNATEPTCKVRIYQGVPKGDKLEDIIQKCTEVGVTGITPVLMKRSISRPDAKGAAKKNARYRKIALEAAQQSGRGIVPKIGEQITLKQAIAADESKLKILFYEGGGDKLQDIVSADTESLSFYIGPEGGFDETEVELLVNAGAKIATLGPRILRTQTAPVVALSAIMMITDNM